NFGSLGLTSIGAFRYIPNPDFNGVDTFTYRVFDGELYSNVAAVTITVNPVNDPPTANNDFYSTLENTPIVRDAAQGVLANDVDIDGDALVAALATGPSNGSLAFQTDGSFEYIPNNNFVGTDSFTYTVTDPDGETDTATVLITVGDVNTPPVARPDYYSVNEDTALTGNVTSNDYDLDG